MTKINGMEYYSRFDAIDIPMIRIKALVRLVNACGLEGVQITKVSFFQTGFSVLFDGVKGDAVIHDNSYGSDGGEWESFGMPWDYGDVSIHTPEELARLIGLLQRGEYKEEE